MGVNDGVPGRLRGGNTSNDRHARFDSADACERENRPRGPSGRAFAECSDSRRGVRQRTGRGGVNID